MPANTCPNLIVICYSFGVVRTGVGVAVLRFLETVHRLFEKPRQHHTIPIDESTGNVFHSVGNAAQFFV